MNRLAMRERLSSILPAEVQGQVIEVNGDSLAVAGLPVPVGALVHVKSATGKTLPCEVIGFQRSRTVISPLDTTTGVRRGAEVRLVNTRRELPVGEGCLGRVINAHGGAIDQRPQPLADDRVPLVASSPIATKRPSISVPFTTGIRAIDGMLTCGQGQRVGIFAGSGVGKSVLMGMLARHCVADVIVVGMVGERGRELNDFLSRDLGSEGLKRSVVVVATSDEPAVVRVQAAQAATSLAEYFRDQGKNVLLLLDSLTRVALAQREIGVARGEPPTTRGFPPSVFSLLPKLVERTGNTEEGTITAFYTVLVEGDDPNEPIADSVRGLLDGHIWLSRRLASSGHYPAIDVLDSVSRLALNVRDKELSTHVNRIRSLLTARRDHDDMISIGAYKKGSNPRVDAALELEGELIALLVQSPVAVSTWEETAVAVQSLGEKVQTRLNL